MTSFIQFSLGGYEAMHAVIVLSFVNSGLGGHASNISSAIIDTVFPLIMQFFAVLIITVTLLLKYPLHKNVACPSAGIRLYIDLPVMEFANSIE
jgi:hypothetical protein